MNRGTERSFKRNDLIILSRRIKY